MRIRFDVNSPGQWRKTHEMLARRISAGKLRAPSQPSDSTKVFAAQTYLANAADKLFFHRRENRFLLPAFSEYVKGERMPPKSDLLLLTSWVMKKKRFKSFEEAADHIQKVLKETAGRAKKVCAKMTSSAT